jgi:LPXTG-motif cell wall-anchored protein
VLPGVGAHAADDKIDQTVDGATSQVQGATGGSTSEPAPAPSQAPAPKQSSTATVPSSPPPAPSSDDDLPGHETEDPAPPDHGGAQVADVDLDGNDVADVAGSTATIEDNDDTNSDATLLALGGEEIIGAHADSNGTKEDHAGDPLAPLCEGTEGGVCLRILYADAYADEDGSTSSSSSQTGVADVCVGGDSADPQAECTGPVSAGAGQSQSEAERDQRSGRTTASSRSSLADANVGQGQVTAGAVQSEGWADSGNSPASADRSSSVANLAVAGTPLEAEITDPFAIAVPPDCPDPSLVCVFANQGETYIGDGIAGHAQEALHVEALNGALLTELARSETLVHNDGGEPAGPGNPGPGNPGPGNPGPGGPDGPAAGPGDDAVDVADAQAGDAADDGILPNTGGFSALWLALAGGMIAAGAGMLVGRRRVTDLA